MFNLPFELLLQICLRLPSLEDIISFRKTCKAFNAVTRDRSLWLQQREYQQKSFGRARARLHASEQNAADIEREVFEAQNMIRKWHLLRTHTTRKPRVARLGDVILLLRIYLERWLLCVYAEGTISLWDLALSRDESQKIAWKGMINSNPGVSWSSVIDTVDENENIMVAVAETGGPSLTRIYCINPWQSHTTISYQVIGTARHPLPAMIRAIDLKHKLLIFSRNCFIDLIDWEHNKIRTINTQVEELDELDFQWNGILGVRTHDSHLICIKFRSIDLYSLSSIRLDEAPSNILLSSEQRQGVSHSFASTAYRGFSISDVHCTTAGTFYFSLLGYDVLRGLRHDLIHVTPQPSPILNVQSVAAYSMTDDIPGARTRTRGFVSACALGTEGLRGVWVERTRGIPKRLVMVYTAPHASHFWGAPDNMPTSNPEDDVVPIDARLIYEESAVDLREDIMHCTFSEATGVIVFGLRSGEIRILDL